MGRGRDWGRSETKALSRKAQKKKSSNFGGPVKALYVSSQREVPTILLTAAILGKGAQKAHGDSSIRVNVGYLLWCMMLV